MTIGSVLVVANQSDPDPGFVGDRLVERGFSLLRTWREDGVPDRPPEGAAAVLLLGSAWSVAHPERPDALEAECALVRAAGAVGVPVLGLCYGAQVLAHAYGGRVSTARVPEVGLVDVETTDERLVPSGPWWAFHADVIGPPTTAHVVARNDCGVQAFVLPGALGVQFHPEVRPSVLQEWLQRFPSMAHSSGVAADDLVALAHRHEESARAAASELVDNFLDHAQQG